MAQQALNTAEIDKRKAARKAILLVAGLDTGHGEQPVRLRDLSESGALLEGPALPAPGAEVVLKRLDLAMPAKVMWAARNRCGIQFSGEIRINDWVMGRQHDSAGARDQIRIDAMQAAFRKDKVEPALIDQSVPASPGRISNQHFDMRLSEEIAYVQRMLEMMSDRLIDDPAIVHRHAETLQHFDLASQILGHVSAIIQCEDRVAAVDRIGMEDLRARLKRKPLT